MRQGAFTAGVTILAFLLLVNLPLKSSSQIRQTKDDSSRIHRLQVLMNQGLIMFLDGVHIKVVSNMIMVTLLASIPQIDECLENQGWIMVKEVRTLIGEVTRSDLYRRILETEGTSIENPLFVQTRQCADLSLKIADILSRMNIGGKVY